MKTPRSKTTLSNLTDRLPRLLRREAVDEHGRDKGPKTHDAFEVWHHHGQLRRPGDWALMLQFDQRR